MLHVDIYKTIQEIDKRVFSQIVSEETIGSWDYYYLLEKSNALCSENGWTPEYVAFKIKDIIIGLSPLFIKTHSEAEFCYDHSFVKDYESITNKSYYPKGQVCIPYMPVETTKLYFANEFTHQKINAIDCLKDHISRKNLSSVHFSLPNQQEYSLFLENGFFNSTNHICYWYNLNFTSFQDFLLSLRSKYRAQILRERTHVANLGLKSAVYYGSSMNEEKLQIFFSLWKETHQRKNWGDVPLNMDFFINFCSRKPNNIVFFFLNAGKKTVAAACNFLDSQMLFGRFWGSLHDNDFLQFETCYYLPIEFAIEQKLSKMEVGFYKMHKLIRGFLPKPVDNFHYFPNLNFHKLANESFKKQAPIFRGIYKEGINSSGIHI